METEGGGTSLATRLELDNYEIGITLGTGSFGRVRIAKEKKTGKYVAVKILKKAEIIKMKQVDHIMNENNILASIDHPFIIYMDGFTQDDKHLYLVIEFVRGGEMFTYLRGIGKFDAKQAQFYSSQVASMFEYLHSKNIIYRDLKPENILIDHLGYLKLTDFGFAKIVESRTYTLCGTPEYLAPEMLLNKGHGKPVDWWTFGILLYEMIAGIDPFSDEDPMLIYQKILKGKVKFPRSFDKNAKSLVKHLLQADLAKRYGNLKRGVKDIKGHRFYNGLNWTSLLKKEIDPPYIPPTKGEGDTGCFSPYPDSDTETPPVKESEDPFLEW